jgi:hypothetical protein
MAQESPESGVCLVDAREYLEEAPSENSSIWGKTVVSNVGNGAVPLIVDRHTDGGSFANLNPANILLTSTAGGHTKRWQRIRHVTCPIFESR